MVNANKTWREKMSRNFIYSLIEKAKANTALLLLCLSIVLPGSAHAKGGDLIAPFPVTDALALKQEAKAMATDSSGNIIVTGYANAGGMNNNYHTVKFRADGSGIAWRSTFDKSGGDDQATAVAIDSADNVIVTGTVWNGSNTDIHTIKYSGVDGSVLWQHTWSGAAGGADIATSIAIDTGGNIYIAGYTANTNGNDDYLILKYPAAGTTPAWQDIYNSSYNSNDRILSIAAGLDGIAVTGISSKGGTDFDILTRKHGFDGTLIWEQRKASPTGGDDRGRTVKIDSTGSVIISGYLYNGQNNDIYTAKYAAAAPGTALWEKAYAGGGNDEPLALWLDTNDEIYLTGHTYTYSGNEDFYTVRYASTDGVKIWDRIYDSGSDYTDIATAIIGSPGAEGDIYVTGYTATNINENFTTLKYKKSSGELIWQKNYQSTTNKSARPVGIALGLSGDPVIAGWTDTSATSYDFVVVRYDYGRLDPPSGLSVTATSNSTTTLNWLDNSTNETTFKIERKLGESGDYTQIATVAANVTTYADSSLTPNSYYYYRIRSNNATNGDSYYSSEAHALTKIVSYDPPAWIYQYNGADNREDEAVGIVVGSDNHPIVTGFSDLTEEGVTGAYSFDYMTIKLDKDTKAIKWKAPYDSGDGGTDMAAGITLDNNGDAVVAGTAYLSGGSEKSDDLYTIKYSSAGHTDPLTSPLAAWGAQYGTQAGIDQATAIQAAKDSANNIIVIGHGINTNNDEDMFIIKYRPDGTTAWPPIVYDGPAHGNDYPSAVAIDQTGDIFITGSTENAAGDFDIYTAKYSGASGALIWAQTYAGAGNGDDHGLSLAIDTSGDIYITGSSVNLDGNEEWITINYDGADSSPNRELWRKNYNGPAAPVNGNDKGIAIGIDPMDGAIIVAGTSYRTLTDSDFHLIRYSPADGSIIWERNFDRPAKYDYLTAMAIDSSGYIYLTGNSRNGPDTDPAFDASSDVLGLIYDFEGTFLSASEYDGGRKDEAVAIAVNYQGEAFIAGVTLNANNPDYLVMKQKHDYILVPAPFLLSPQGDYGQINLHWQNNTPGTSFLVERTQGPVLPGSEWVTLATASPGTTNLSDTGLSAGTNYCYRIYAFSGSLNSRTVVRCANTTLAAPILNPLNVNSATRITLAWNQVPENTGYKVERKIGGGIWSEIALTSADITSYADAGLSPGTIYSYRVSSRNGSGYSSPSNEQAAPSLSTAPVMAAIGAVTINSVVLNWSNVEGETGYRLERREGLGGVWGEVTTTLSEVTTYTDAGLAANTQYYYRVTAYNVSGNSEYSAEKPVMTSFTSPTLLSATGSATDKIILSWTNVPGNTGYTILEAYCGYSNNPNDTLYCIPSNYSNPAIWSQSFTAGTTSADVVTYTVADRSSGYAYAYSVIANTTGNSSTPSNIISAWTYMTPPVLTVSPASETSLTVSWGNINAASNYTLERKLGVTGTYADLPGASGMPVDASSFTDAGLLQETQYCYRIKAYSVLENNPPPLVTSNEKCLFTPLPAPVLNDLAVVSSTQINLSWTNIPGNTGYEIKRCNAGYADYPEYVGYYGNNPANDYWFWSCNPPVSVPQDSVSFQDTTSLYPGYTYRYQIRDIFPGGTSAFSATKDTITKPTAPTLTAVPASTTQINLNWNNVEGENGYKLEWKARSGADCITGVWSEPILIGENTTSYQHGGLTVGTHYCFRLKAYNIYTESAYSNELFQTTSLDPPTLEPLTGVTGSQIVLTWNNVTGNTGYRIERKVTAVGGWGTVYTTASDAITYTDTVLSAGTVYFYRVSTNNAGGSSLPGNEQSTTTTPATAIINTTAISSARVDLSWQLVFGATNYKIERKEGAGNYSEITNIPLTYAENYCGNSFATIGCPSLSPVRTEYRNTGLTENTTYCYKLKTWNISGGDSVYSDEKCATSMNVPDQNLVATALNSFKIKLDWSPISCSPVACGTPEGYEVERLIRDGNWVNIATVGAIETTFTDRIGIDSLKQYNYRVRSFSGGSKSPYTSAVAYTPPYATGDNVGP